MAELRQKDLISFGVVVFTSAGWLVESHESRRGMPHLVAMKEGRMVCAWFLTEKGSLTKAQQPFRAQLKAVSATSGGRVSVHEWKAEDRQAIWDLAASR